MLNYIEAAKGVFYPSYAVEHELDERNIGLNCKSELEPIFFKVKQAVGEIPTNQALYLNNED